jgi:hypothetical protein
MACGHDTKRGPKSEKLDVMTGGRSAAGGKRRREGRAFLLNRTARFDQIVGTCTAKAHSKVMFATTMRCCSILVIVAMAFVVPSASSATSSQPPKKDSAGILRLADEVHPLYLSDLCSSRDAPSASSIELGMHQCKHWQQRKRQ